jgi:hypothetical protein
MALSVIGAGFGRTGTSSLKLALETLGFDKCYHMEEWIAHAEHTAHWRAAMHGGTPDWDALFDGYRAAVDFPVCSFYRSLCAHYPDAKVVLTTRDLDSWYNSANATIYPSSTQGLRDPSRPPESLERLKLIDETAWQGMFGGRFEEREHAIAALRKHQQAVQDHVPSERLLVYQVSQGWQPLCEFLGVDVPELPFPNTNTRTEFISRMTPAPS